jgi:murein DD-endopeptidase MepM/ murein hydrolase activator NlpD
MSRKLFVFNKETGSFEEHRPSPGKVAARVLHFLAGGIVAAAFFYTLFALFYSNRQEKALEQENAYLQEHYANLLERSDMVDDVIEGLEARDSKIYKDIFDAAPPDFDAVMPTDSPDVLEEYYSAGEASLIEESRQQLERLAVSAAQVDRLIGAIGDRLADEKFSRDNFPSVIPLRNFTLAATGATVGKKINPFFKSMMQHNGIDLMAPYGTEVIATADGRVVDVLRQGKGLGNLVVIDHGSGLRTVYAHLSDIYVAINQNVKRGRVIGKVGSSGASFTASLHYEVRKEGRAMDPVNYFFASLSPSAYGEMLLVANTTGQSLD